MVAALGPVARDDVLVRAARRPRFRSPDVAQLPELVKTPSHIPLQPGSLLVVYGPGAALAPHDVLWYADLPKRFAEAAILAGTGLNLGQPVGAGPGTKKRLFFVDWPLIDGHRDFLVERLDGWVDMQIGESPTMLDGHTLRATVAELAGRPFRTRPTFNSRRGVATGRSKTSATTRDDEHGPGL